MTTVMVNTEEDTMKTERENGGLLFRKLNRENDREPNWQGDCLVGGHRYRMAAWSKTDRNGKEFLSLAFTAQVEDEADGRDR